MPTADNGTLGVPNTPGGYEQSLSDGLTRYGDREFMFVEPTGNWGDDLIYRGAETLAKRLGLTWRTLTVDQFVATAADPDRAIYIHGGGGFNRWCSGKALRALAHAVTHYRGPVINGPMTVDDTDGYVDEAIVPALERASACEIVVYVRERTSLRSLAGRLPSGIHLRLDHDTALHLTPQEALAGQRMGSRYTLFALREDDEAPSNADPRQFRGVRLDPAMYARSFDHWIRIHALARSIVTNRTHSSMAGTVLGKPTTLLGGSYHKNRSIWEYSLRSRGVRWLDWEPKAKDSLRARTAAVGLPFIGRIARSWKVQRTMHRLQGVPWS